MCVCMWMYEQTHTYIYIYVYVYIYIYAATVKDMREGCILALFLGSHFWALKSMFFSIFSDRKNSEYSVGNSPGSVLGIDFGTCFWAPEVTKFWGCSRVAGVVLGLF